MNANDLHIAKINQNCLSSIHLHNNLYNFLFNIEGCFYVNFPNTGYELEIEENWAVEVAPGIKHQFYASSYATILESYYEQPLRSLSYYDIERFPNA